MKPDPAAPSASASIIAFPLPIFTPSDHPELYRWTTAASAVAGWRVQEDPDTGQLVEHAHSGAEYAVLSNGWSAAGGSYIIEPRAGRWELSDPNSKLIATFRTLRDALEHVCQTIAPACRGS
jgi:hypothetical protein